ncbi:MAG TPA: AraC family transcriptional regulator [Xanthobacteraceae bacterium]|nr:AraC family transcriptional regulator [Xanthobacteraceae bacterium]
MAKARCGAQLEAEIGVEGSASQVPGTAPAPFCLEIAVTPGNGREFDLWRSGMSPLFALDAEHPSARPSFGAELTSYQFGDVAVSSGVSSAAIYERTEQTIARSGIDSIGLIVYLDGGCALDVEGHAEEVRTGDVCILDMTRESTVRSPAHKDVSIVLPRTLVEPNLADPEALHGRILRRASPLNTMLVNHLRTLIAQAPALGLSEADAAARATAALVAAFAGASTDGRETLVRFAATHALQTARRIIEANIENPELGTDFICRQLGVSRAKLYRLFEPIGGISYFIQQRRLRRACQDITDTRFVQERIGAIAARYGFSSVSVFSRAFRQAYGTSPSSLREEHSQARKADVSHSGDRAFELMKRWLLGVEATA